MVFLETKTPDEYQEFFYRQIGLLCVRREGKAVSWKCSEIGSVESFGSMERVQAGIGDYTVTSDFLVKYQYNDVYLHFGIIYEGITYSVVKERLIPMSIPSSFLAIEKASGGINRWKRGQKFKGVEISVNFRYLNEVLLPVLGYDSSALNFLKENVRYLHLPDEMKSLLFRTEQLLQQQRMTDALQISLTLELIALLLHGENRAFFNRWEASPARQLQIGKRSIHITKIDFEKIMHAHELISDSAASFPNSYALSRALNISEQKLKVGFFALYQQTIWDYSNNVRMNAAVELLRNTDDSISEIAAQVGYQSQTAFHNMFKKWSGITPRQFRLQLRTADSI